MNGSRPKRSRFRLIILFPVFFAVCAAAARSSAEDWGALRILDREVEPGTRQRLSFLYEDAFVRDVIDIHVLAIRGVHPGPTLCLTAGVHGDEVNGVEIARRSHERIDPSTLSGTLISIPFVNAWGFKVGNRYLADRRDLNRAFPGIEHGSLGDRIAYHVFEEVIRHCDALVDLHTGSAERANLPQIRVDLGNPTAVDLATRFDVGIVIGGAGPEGSLRREATKAGVAAIIYEAGGPYRFEHEEIERGVVGVTNVMETLDMLESEPPDARPQSVFRSTSWLRSPGAGIFLTNRKLGEQVREGDVLGTVTDPITSESQEVLAHRSGTLIGMAHPQVVLPGFGLFHVGQTHGTGIEATERSDRIRHPE